MTDRNAKHTNGSEIDASLTTVASDDEAIDKQLGLLEVEIADERNHPLRQLKSYLIFQILTRLSRFSPPLPQRMAARFVRSAAKKDPNRSVVGRDGPLVGSVATKPLSVENTGKIPYDPNKKNILIVSHEASRTGAPILALNLVHSLSSRYNITVLLLRGGNILENFRSSSVAVYVADNVGQFGYGQLISGICSAQRLAFAVVNTVEARGVLRHLRNMNVPTVTLVHEFASYVRSKSWRKSPFRELFDGSSEVVFSTSLTLEAAQIRNQKIDMSKAIILPQGKCDIPKDANNTANSSEEKAWLRVVLRPSSFIDDRPVVIGAGSVIFRKGVDLFIEMATRVLKMPGGENTFFFWIGASHHPDQPWDYPVYLEDQIRRAGVENRVTILRGTSEIELAYSLADIFVLSSRLDPLPNVAIDAMSVGLPVICFENASGIAEFLVDASLRDACVADYIDTHALAEKVYALVTDPTLRGKVSTRIQEYAETAFNFDSYARKIESLGLNARVG